MYTTRTDSYERPLDLSPISERERLKSRFKLFIGVWAALLVAVPLAAIYLQHKGSEQPVRSVRLSTGVYVTADAVTAKMTKEDFEVNVREIFESYFLYTENGGLNALQPFVHPAAWTEMQKQMERVYKRKDKKSYRQEMVISELRWGYGQGDDQAFSVRGLLKSRDSHRYVANEVFYGVRFKRTEITNENTLGWWLAEIGPIDKKIFYKKETAAEDHAATAVKGEIAPPAKPVPAPKQ